MSKKVLVIGSSNTDMVVKTAAFPKPGETVLGGKFFMNPGGKGANQAVAAARLGANVRFVAKTGNDIFGKQAAEGFVKEDLDTQFLIQTNDFASGVALISVNEKGENQIVVASGANMDLKPQDLPDAIFENVEWALVQLEIPMQTIEYVVKKCASLNIKVILNPAPADTLKDELLKDIYLITPNETETQLLTGILPENPEKLEQAASFFHQKGVENVVITLGKDGVFLSNNSYSQIIPAVEVDPMDTTAAGDVFNGAVLAALSNGKDWIEACEFACNAAALSVTRMGAQSSAPFLKELN
ncbi:ribokinase [Dyadobacter psychrotolerans]|uniref:Ribokinase n=1 Tax=Dyadobacter psychrotolerans TaxID=2541721 RepID=A0A4R5DE83_9BACT|nr:ribokinase [Dyadobacter psychrotolerans]TDE10270.1 ribokinase [Dyadobacter psychrotolerans]